MARIRSVKPELFLDEELAELDPLTRFAYIGLWTQADREGRLKDRPRRLKAQILPYDDGDFDEILNALAAAGFITRYEADGAEIIQVKNFLRHQMPHYKEVPSELPPPDGHTDSQVIAKPLTKTQRDAIFERDGEVCAECGATDDLTIDHIVPVSRGGDSSADNLRVLCRSCNASKGNRLNVGSTSAQPCTQEGKGKEGKGREQVVDAPPVSKSGNLPPCLTAPNAFKRHGVPYTSALSLIGSAIEAKAGRLASPADLALITGALTDSCHGTCSKPEPIDCAVFCADRIERASNLRSAAKFITSDRRL